MHLKHNILLTPTLAYNQCWTIAMLLGYLVSVCQVELTCTDTVNEKRIQHHDVWCRVDSLPYVLIAVLANKFYAELKKTSYSLSSVLLN